MLALAEVRAMSCPGCGGDLAETTSHETWDPLPPLQCFRCDAIAAQQDRYAQDYKHMHVFRWGATRRG
jgi:hypothetical protein